MGVVFLLLVWHSMFLVEGMLGFRQKSSFTNCHLGIAQSPHRSVLCARSAKTSTLLAAFNREEEAAANDNAFAFSPVLVAA